MRGTLRRSRGKITVKTRHDAVTPVSAAKTSSGRRLSVYPGAPTRGRGRSRRRQEHQVQAEQHQWGDDDAMTLGLFRPP